MLRRTLPFLLALAALAPATAHAGSYHVYTCAAGGGNWGNAAWTGSAVTNYVVDTNCTPAGSLIGLRIDGNKAIANGSSASLTFTSPIGTWITDFRVNRLLDFNSNPALAGTRPLYALYSLGRTPFAGAGDYDTSTRRRLQVSGGWYGYPAGDATISRRTTSLRQFGALAAYRGGARTLSITVGCFRRTTNCSAPAGGRVYHVLYGVDVTVYDPAPPSPTVAAEGLLARGQRHGSDPVVLSATDNAGIRRVELWDVTGAAPVLVGARDATCTPRLAKPCPDLAKTPIVPTALRIGRREVLVRTIDGAGSQKDSARSPSTSSRRRRAAASTAPARPRRRRSAPGSRRAASASAPSATGARS